MTDEVVINPADTEVIGFAPLGEVFSSARNAKKLTLKDVSNNLRLSVKQIESIENNDFTSLPPAVITRGFLRNYARFLELDADPLLASYRARMPDVVPSTLTVKTSMNKVMPSSGNSSSFKYFLLGGLVLLSLTSWFYYANYMQKAVPQKTATFVATTVSQPVSENTPLPEVALPAAEREAQNEVVDTQVAANTVEGNASDTKDAVDPQVPPSSAEISPKPVPSVQPKVNNPSVVTQNLQLPKEAAVDSNTIKLLAVQKIQLPSTTNEVNAKAFPANEVKAIDNAKNSLKSDASIASMKGVNIAVSEKTWVRVTDKSGAVVFERMLQANSEEGFNGIPPFNMLIGNAKATKLKFLGQDVDLTNKTRNNVARITLE
jgi:cytoskeleton protein RodZ